MMGKENMDPRGLSGILKNNQTDEDRSNNNTIYSTKSEGNTTKFNRRVSFAPEVTLHKIDFVPQSEARRQTIGHTPMNRDLDEKSDSSGSGSSSSSVHSIYDEEDRVWARPADQADSTTESAKDIQESISIPPLPSAPPLAALPDAYDSSDLEDSEVEMELTEPISAKEKPDEMELTQTFAKVTTPQKDDNTVSVPQEDDMTMEFTRPLPVIKQVENVAQKEQDETMDLTHTFTKISATPSTNTASNNESSTEIHNDEMTMEITQPLSHINHENTLSTISEGNEEESNKTADQEMEITQPLSVIKPTSDDADGTKVDSVGDAEASKEEMSKETTESAATQADEPAPQIPDKEEQKGTVYVDAQELSNSSVQKGLQNLSLVSPQKSPKVIAESDRSSLSFDVEVPIPSDLGSKRYSEMEDEQIHKTPKLAEHSTVHTVQTVPLADVSMESIRYSNYQQVTLSQFLNDLGIKFFDDIELDDVSNEELSRRFSEQEHQFDDYIRASGKLLVYSLYEFSNKDLSKNIVEGRKLFQQLNDSILENNPEFFKEFYSSSYEEQESLKADFSLIQEYCKFQARNTWYNWRIQLIENLLVKLNAKYDLLVEDKAKLENNIKLIDQEYKESFKNLNSLKIKISLLRTLRVEFDSQPERFTKLKSQLSDSKEKIVKIKAEVEKRSKELTSVTSTIKEYDMKITNLNKEVKRQQDFIDNNKKFSLNDIKILNFNNKLLQEASSMKVEKTDDGVVFHYREFDFVVDSNVTVEIKKRKLFNDWIYDHIETSIKAVDDMPVMEKCQAIRKIIDKLVSLDKEIFKMSIKLPLTKLDTDPGQLGFKVKLCKNDDYKVLLRFQTSVERLILEEGFKFNLSYEVTKSSSTVDYDSLLAELKVQCHLTNRILSDVVV